MTKHYSLRLPDRLAAWVEARSEEKYGKGPGSTIADALEDYVLLLEYARGRDVVDMSEHIEKWKPQGGLK